VAALDLTFTPPGSSQVTFIPYWCRPCPAFLTWRIVTGSLCLPLCAPRRGRDSQPPLYKVLSHPSPIDVRSFPQPFAPRGHFHPPHFFPLSACSMGSLVPNGARGVRTAFDSRLTAMVDCRGLYWGLSVSLCGHPVVISATQEMHSP